MQIELLAQGKLKITLTGDEVRELSADAVRDKTAITERELLTLLERARKETGFQYGKNKLFAEILTYADGGCAIFFTTLPEEYPEKNAGLKPVIFAFDSADELCEGAAKLFSLYSHRIYKSSLYSYRGQWRLIMYPLDYLDRLSVHFLSEYGDVAGENVVLAAFIDEHGEKIIADDAIDTLARYFG